MSEITLETLYRVIPSHLTPGAYYFFRDVYRILDFGQHGAWTAATLDELAGVTSTIFLSSDLELSDEHRQLLQKLNQHGLSAVERSKKFEPFLAQLVFSRLLDS